MNAVTEHPILLEHRQHGIATLTLNRPAQYNALSGALLRALQNALDSIAVDEAVQVVIITASGKAFCPGHDLKEVRSSTDPCVHEALFQQCSKMMMTINQLPQPVIARVNGVATAAGCQLVAACDLAVAAENARFAVSGINLGLFCSTPAVALSRNLSRKHALKMLLTGEFINAATALQYGLINQITTAEDLDTETLKLAMTIAEKAPIAVRTGKKMFYTQLEKNLSDAYAYASTTMACNMDTDDAREGVDAFFEKRQPQWRNR